MNKLFQYFTRDNASASESARVNSKNTHASVGLNISAAEAPQFLMNITNNSSMLIQDSRYEQHLIVQNINDSSLIVPTNAAGVQKNNRSVAQLDDSMVAGERGELKVTRDEQINLSSISAAPITKIDSRITTIQIKLLAESKSSTKIADSTEKNKIFVEVRALDVRYKEISKQIYIFYELEEFFYQLDGCQFLRGFKSFSRQHIEQCLFSSHFASPSPSPLKRKAQHLRYYLQKIEEGEYQGQCNKYKVLEGNGIISYQDGRIYRGEIKCRRRHGLGTCVWPSGSVYQGQWEYDEMEGTGILKEASDEIYEGGFAKNQKEGMGTVQWKNGSCMQGTWKNGQQEGVFVMKAQGKQASIVWKNGQIVKVNQTDILLHPQDKNVIVLDFKQDQVRVAHSHKPQRPVTKLQQLSQLIR